MQLMPQKRKIKDCPQLAWPGLMEAIQRMNAWVFHRRLRNWQYTLAHFGTMTLPDPQTGRDTACIDSVYSTHKCFGYLFMFESGPAWLLTGPCSNGFNIVGIIYKEYKELILFDDEDIFTTSVTLESISALVDCNITNINMTPRIGLVVGHQNFAHFMWNELPGLMALEAGRLRGLDDIITTHAPFGDVDSYMRLDPRVPRRMSVGGGNLARRHGPEPVILFACGATQMHEAASERVRAACGGAAPRDPSRFGLWLSFRSTHRSAHNYADLYARLVDAITDHGVACTLLLDGFSLPMDIEQFDDDSKNRLQQIVHQEARLAYEFIANLPAKIRDVVAVRNGTNLNLADSIRMAGSADAYLCHQGTQQHKIGWLYSTPGIVHAPPDIAGRMPGGWTKDQSEVSSLPVFVPEHLVENVPGETDSNDYSFRNVTKTVEFLMAELDPVLRQFKM